jgi:hypothetical protein
MFPPPGCAARGPGLRRRIVPGGWLRLVAIAFAAVVAGPRVLGVIQTDGRHIHVAAGGTGDGSSGAPLGSIRQALDLAQPGDVIDVGPGEFRERLTTTRAGRVGAPISIRGTAERQTLVTSPGRVLTISHESVTVEDVVFDGQYGPDDALRIGSSAHGTALRRVEVRRAGRDCVDIGSPRDVLIEDSLIHHCLNPAGGRTDAHGIVAVSAQRLTIRGTEIHTFSGDAVQVDAPVAGPGWDDLTIEGAHFWLAPLPAAENGFSVGTIPGENALDTKTPTGLARSRVTVRDSVFHGFRTTLIANAAAFNLKEHVDAVVDRVTVYDSEIAFRLRGPESTGALVRVSNAVVHDVATAFRYENDIQGLRIWNATIGGSVARPFQRATADASVLDVRNLLLLGTSKPPEAAASSNLAVSPAVFVDAAAHDYRLRTGSAPIDRGASLDEVTADRDGVRRPNGAAHDIGAYEWCPGDCRPPRPPTGVRVVK